MWPVSDESEVLENSMHKHHQEDQVVNYYTSKNSYLHYKTAIATVVLHEAKQW